MLKVSLPVTILLIFIFMLVIPVAILFVFRNNEKGQKWGIGILSFFYFIMLFWGVFGQVSIENNFVIATLPFDGKWFYAHNFMWHNFGLGNILVNLFLFFPMGYIVFTFCKKHKILKTILSCLCLSFCVELFQFVLPCIRTVEVTDLLFNTLSGVISATFMTFLYKILHKEV